VNQKFLLIKHNFRKFEEEKRVLQPLRAFCTLSVCIGSDAKNPARVAFLYVGKQREREREERNIKPAGFN
jgi:hypothetical protein